MFPQKLTASFQFLIVLVTSGPYKRSLITACLSSLNSAYLLQIGYVKAATTDETPVGSKIDAIVAAIRTMSSGSVTYCISSLSSYSLPVVSSAAIKPGSLSASSSIFLASFRIASFAFAYFVVPLTSGVTVLLVLNDPIKSATSPIDKICSVMASAHSELDEAAPKPHSTHCDGG